MAETLPPDTQFAALLRQLDDLLAEAVRLREQIQQALTANAEPPFWPDRRQKRVSVPRDRRG